MDHKYLKKYAQILKVNTTSYYSPLLLEIRTLRSTIAHKEIVTSFGEVLSYSCPFIFTS